MSLPPPSSGPSGGTLRDTVIPLESRRARRRRGAPEDALRLSALGAVLEHEDSLIAPLRLPLGTLQLGLIERGAARPSGLEGRFPVLRRLGPASVVPREHGVEGWLWTSTGGSALTRLGGDGDAPNAALLFTKPLGEDIIGSAFAPALLAEIAARSPLGAPAVYGLLFRVADPLVAERAFRSFGLLRPLTDREVPPTLRRSLPTDRSAAAAVGGSDAAARAAGSVAPPA
jgi:hypothetical protein